MPTSAIGNRQSAIGNWALPTARSVSRLGSFDRPLLHPGHQPAQARAHLLDAVLLPFLEQSMILLVAGLVFLDPTAGELAGLHILERGFHPLLHARIDDLRPD